MQGFDHEVRSTSGASDRRSLDLYNYPRKLEQGIDKLKAYSMVCNELGTVITRATFKKTISDVFY